LVLGARRKESLILRFLGDPHQQAARASARRRVAVSALVA
jgi:hypothetical protein